MKTAGDRYPVRRKIELERWNGEYGTRPCRSRRRTVAIDCFGQASTPPPPSSPPNHAFSPTPPHVTFDVPLQSLTYSHRHCSLSLPTLFTRVEVGHGALVRFLFHVSGGDDEHTIFHFLTIVCWIDLSSFHLNSMFLILYHCL